jgi:hypothetical protein
MKGPSRINTLVCKFMDHLTPLSRIAKVHKELERTDLQIYPFVVRAMGGDLMLEALLLSAMQILEEFRFNWTRVANRNPEDPDDAGVVFWIFGRRISCKI